MMKKKKFYDDDDGRSVADMSQISHPTFLGGMNDAVKKEEPKSEADIPEWEKSPLSKSQRRSFIWGALSAALLIGLAFIAGLALIIWLFTLI